MKWMCITLPAPFLPFVPFTMMVALVLLLTPVKRRPVKKEMHTEIKDVSVHKEWEVIVLKILLAPQMRKSLLILDL